MTGAPRTVLTTGANSGLGLATVLEVARRGFRSVGSVRSDEKAECVKRAAAEAGVEVETVLLDVDDAEACARVVGGLELYGLVNNAGYPGVGAVEDVTDAEARAQLETMVVAPMRLARLALPAMRAAGGGRIVNLSSIAGLTSSPLSGWYHACKHALETLSDALRMEVAGDGVKVVLVEPGGFDTAIWQRHEDDVAGRAGSRYDAAYRRQLDLARLVRPAMGDPARVAGVVAGALASSRPRARYLVGSDAHWLRALNRLSPQPVRDRVSRLLLRL